MAIKMLNISSDLETSINHLARKTGQSVDDFLSALVTEFQSEMEALQRAKEVLAGIDTGIIKTVPLAEVMKEYDMDY
jgi:predicted DNA-binding protein